MFAGWQKIITVNLCNRKVSVADIDEALYKNYFSGSGLAAYILYQKGTYAAEPLGPDNDLIFIPGLLTGTPTYTASRTSLCAKSPLTGIWGETNFGGYWGSTLKAAGYDGLWVIGSSESPVYIWIRPGKVEIRDAQDLWGKNTFESEKTLRDKTHEKARVLCIGRGGEKLAKMASVISEGLKARAGGRTGLGAVMGSKKLKAVVVLGGGTPIPLYNPSAHNGCLRDFLPSIKQFTLAHTQFGTARLVVPKEAIGGLPIKNFSPGIPWPEGALKISGQAIAQTIRQKDYSCYYCPIKCGKEVKIPSGPYAGLVGRGPEYETIAGFGANLFNDDLESIVTANYLCNDYGLDTISASITLAFASEAFERGLITGKDCDGLELTWGDTRALLGMLRKIGEREGIGDLLAEGSRMAARRIGGISEELVAHAKGLEPSTTAPTPTVSLALNWATSNRGACHLEAFSHIVEGGVPFEEGGYDKVDGYTNEGKGRLVMVMQNYMAVFNALGLCKMLFSARLSPERMGHWVHFVTGWDMDRANIMNIGDRIYNWKRAYNLKCGVTRKDDVITPKLLAALKKEGSLEEKRNFFEKMLVDYYEERGWNQQGIPGPEILQKHGLKL